MEFIPVEKLIEFLSNFVGTGAVAYAYEGEITGVVVCKENKGDVDYYLGYMENNGHIVIHE